MIKTIILSLLIQQTHTSILKNEMDRCQIDQITEKPQFSSVLIGDSNQQRRGLSLSSDVSNYS